MNRKSINIYAICLVLLLMECAYSWFTISLLHGFQTLISLLMFLSFFFIYKDRKSPGKIGIVVYLLVCLGGLFQWRVDPKMTLITFVSRLPLLTLFMLKWDDLIKLSKNIDKCFAFIVGVSLCFFVLNSIGINMPMTERVFYNQYDLENYWYVFTNVIRYEGKFCGFCLEPGYFALLCICLLANNKFDLKRKSSIIYLCSILLSLSLEGYLLLIVGFALSSFAKGANARKVIKYLILLVVVVGMGVYAALNYNGGNNIVSELILERVAFDSELGIVGNNRENEIAQDIVDSIFYTSDILFGIGHDSFMKATNVKGVDLCSWRVFVCVHGAFYTILLALISFLGLKYSETKQVLPFFVIFWLDFYPHGNPFSEVMYFMIIIFLLHSKDTMSNNTIKPEYV